MRLEGWATGVVGEVIPFERTLCWRDFQSSGTAIGARPSPLRQELDGCVVAFDQRFLLGARPALDLALDRDGIGDIREMLGPDKFNRQPSRRIATEDPAAMLGEPALQPRRADPT